MAYQSLGRFDWEAIENLGFDPAEVFSEVAASAPDTTVVGVHEGDPELWHDDYEEGWMAVGAFESDAAAADAAKGLPEHARTVAYDYSRKQWVLFGKPSGADDEGGGPA